MKPVLRSLAFAGVLGVLGLGLGATPAKAQVVGFGYASPGVSFGLGVGGVPYGGYGGFGYPAVVAAPVIVPRPVVVAPPIYGVRPYYGGYGYGYGPYRHYGYRRW